MARRRKTDSPLPAAAPRLRLDKWLWAARLFRTRSRAKQAIHGGKVHISGRSRPSPSSEVAVGDVLRVRQGHDLRELVVKALSDQRQGAPEAALLYEETEDSLQARQAVSEARRLNRLSWLAGTRPDKRERRERLRLKYGRKDA